MLPCKPLAPSSNAVGTPATHKSVQQCTGLNAPADVRRRAFLTGHRRAAERSRQVAAAGRAGAGRRPPGRRRVVPAQGQRPERPAAAARRAQRRGGAGGPGGCALSHMLVFCVSKHQVCNVWCAIVTVVPMLYTMLLSIAEPINQFHGQRFHMWGVHGCHPAWPASRNRPAAQRH